MTVPDIITKAEAKARGLKHFFTGEPCPKGHVCERSAAHGHCVLCNRERATAWHRANPGKVAARVKQDRAKHPEKKLAYDRAYRARNEEVIAKRILDWQRANKGRIRVITERWRTKNPDKSRAIVLRRRARLAQTPGQHSVEDIDRMLEAQGYQCAAPHCRRDFLYHYSVDHIIPLTRGGTGWPDNLQLLCTPCNSSKGDMTMDEWLATNPVKHDYTPRPRRPKTTRPPGETLKARYATEPGFKEKMNALRKAANFDHTAKMHSLWADPEYRAKRVKAYKRLPLNAAN